MQQDFIDTNMRCGVQYVQHCLCHVDRVQVTAAFRTTRDVAVEEGMRFAIREGGRTVGAGVVASIIE